MKFDCAYCEYKHTDDKDRPILKCTKKSGYILAHFTFCNESHRNLFLDKSYKIKDSYSTEDQPLTTFLEEIKT